LNQILSLVPFPDEDELQRTIKELEVNQTICVIEALQAVRPVRVVVVEEHAVNAMQVEQLMMRVRELEVENLRRDWESRQQ
jgi:hypothetical protein